MGSTKLMLFFNKADARNLNESFSLLSPSCPYLPYLPLLPLFGTEYDRQGFPSIDERINFSKTLLIHASAE